MNNEIQKTTFSPPDASRLLQPLNGSCVKVLAVEVERTLAVCPTVQNQGADRFLEEAARALRGYDEDEIRYVFQTVRNTVKDPLKWAHVREIIDANPSRAWREYLDRKRMGETPPPVREPTQQEREQFDCMMKEVATKLRMTAATKQGERQAGKELFPDHEERLARVDARLAGRL